MGFCTQRAVKCRIPFIHSDIPCRSMDGLTMKLAGSGRCSQLVEIVPYLVPTHYLSQSIAAWLFYLAIAPPSSHDEVWELSFLPPLHPAGFSKVMSTELGEEVVCIVLVCIIATVATATICRLLLLPFPLLNRLGGKRMPKQRCSTPKILCV